MTFWMLELLINCIRVVGMLPSVSSIAFLGLLTAMNIVLGVYSGVETDGKQLLVQANLIRNISFSWFSEINRKFRSTLVDSDCDLGGLDERLQCSQLIEIFRKGKSNSSKGRYSSVATNEGSLSFPKVTMASLLRPFWKEFLIAGLNRLLLTGLFFVCPFLLSKILRNDRKSTAEESHGYVIGILLTSLMIAALNGQYMFDTQKIGLKIKSLLMVAIYEKSLKIEKPSQADVTLLTLDSNRFVELIPNVHMLWSGPLIFLVAMMGLIQVLGLSALIGVVIIAATIGLTKLIGDRLRVLQSELMRCKDPRISSTNEAVGMIRQIKLFCWEQYFIQRILRHRNKELSILRTIINWDAPKYLLGVVSPFIVSLASFGLVILIGEPSLLTLESVFVSIVLFNILKYPLAMVPMMVSQWTATKASVDRIQKYLSGKEIKPLIKTKVESRSRNFSESIEEVLGACRKALDTPVVKLDRASFSLEGRTVLSHVDLSIGEGEFVAITGSVGSGKSLLLGAILGELEQTGGTTSVVGHLGYVPQEAWILHRTVKENILFGQSFDEALYDTVIEACALGSDLASLPNGDETLIGEKGITISGGQQQRILLARALYQDADIYLLDDPLSSVDGEVSKHIAGKMFSSGGILDGKTIIFVTQNQEQLALANKVLFLQEGRISEVYDKQTFRELFGDQQPDLSSEKVHEDAQPSELHVEPSVKSTFKNQGSISPKTYFNYLRMIGKFTTVAIIALNVLIPVCDILSTIWLAKWASIDHSQNSSTDHYFLLTYSVIIVILCILLTFNSTLTTVRGVAVAKEVHRKLLSNTIYQRMKFFDHTSSGQIMSRFVSDLDVVDSMVSTNLRDFLTNLFAVGSILILFCFNTSIYLVLILAVVMVTYCYLLSFHLETSRQLKRHEAHSKSPIILHFNESREGRSSIRAFRREDYFLSQFMAIVDNHQMYCNLYLASSRWLGIRLELIGAVVIYFVAMLSIQNEHLIGASSVGVAISYAFRLIPLLNALVRSSALLEENATSLERIDHYLEERNELDLDPNDSQMTKTMPSPWPTEGSIAFHNLTMQYGEGKFALENISIAINAREKVGIIGRTGAGKSSLISALFQLYPEQISGSISIDGINIATIPLASLRRSLTIIPQSPQLFSGTLRENLDPTCQQASDTELWQALDQCQLKHLVTNLPNQLSSSIDERGSNLSVGQKQLLCLARGILQNRQIVVLDEATSTMDPETERVVQQVLGTAFRDRTVLMIAHRLGTIREVDRVLCMRQGKVARFEKPHALDERDLMEL
ncbi:ATP-binding cassette sub-family C member 2-like isoform X2 [Uranotaenia lowii]|nr:ATP-binding cassette sub-family C member 2-like isoform X2 [Uranotaenia lowii]